jgi:hypothetical protein
MQDCVTMCWLFASELGRQLDLSWQLLDQLMSPCLTVLAWRRSTIAVNVAAWAHVIPPFSTPRHYAAMEMGRRYLHTAVIFTCSQVLCL